MARKHPEEDPRLNGLEHDGISSGGREGGAWGALRRRANEGRELLLWCWRSLRGWKRDGLPTAIGTSIWGVEGGRKENVQLLVDGGSSRSMLHISMPN